MKRRAALAALATGAAAVAGCTTPLGGADDEGSDPGSTPTGSTPTETGQNNDSTPDGTVDLAVESVAATPEVIALYAPDSIGTYGGRSEQYLLARIDANAEPLDPADLGLVVGADTVRPRTGVGSGYRLWEYGEQFTFASEQPDGEKRSSPGWVAFELDNPVETDTVTLQWPGGERAIDDGIVAQLRRPPTTFDVAVDAPEQVADRSAATLSVTVENTGDHRGTFVGALNRIGPAIAYAPVTAVELPLDPGETDTWTHTYSASREQPPFEFTFAFRWRTNRIKQEIEVTGDAD